ncbi:MAG: hypothetical protein QG671_1939 [Actinomycetota bacterium]|nr:hypothetical protein [Actinomycetota bacterium]
MVARANNAGKKLANRAAADLYGINRERINQANVILEFATDLADEVPSGVPLRGTTPGPDTGTLWVTVAPAPTDATSTVGERPMVAALSAWAALAKTRLNDELIPVRPRPRAAPHSHESVSMDRTHAPPPTGRTQAKTADCSLVHPHAPPPTGRTRNWLMH